MTRSFDRRAQRWTTAFLLLFIAVVCAAIALNATVLRPSWPGRLFAALAAAALVWLAVAHFRLRFVVDRKGVSVRNLTSGFSLPCEDIDHFEPPPAHFSREGVGPRFGLRIITRDGRTLHVALWGANRLSEPTFAYDLVAELEAMRSQLSDAK